VSEKSAVPVPITTPIISTPAHALFIEIFILILFCNMVASQSQKWSRSGELPTKPSNAHSHACYMSRLFHPSSLDLANTIWWSVQSMKFLVLLFSPSCYFLSLRPRYLHRFVQSGFFPSVDRRCLYPYSSLCSGFIFVHLSLYMCEISSSLSSLAFE
jgi:hypothetical protein